MKRVLIGILGNKLDAIPSGRNPSRTWRPTLSLFQHPDWQWDRVELLFEETYQTLAYQLLDEILVCSPKTTPVPQKIDFQKNPWDLERVYAALFDWAKSYPFDVENEEYYIHITTGTHVCQICLFLLNESHVIPGKLLQSAPPNAKSNHLPHLEVIDLDLSRYDSLKDRFESEQYKAESFLKQGISTKNTTFNQIIEQLEQVCSRSDAPILLTGPTGSGKSQLAKNVYDLKKIQRRLRGEFIEVNCATLRGDLAASTLFGHVKGAYTGAQTERAGLLKLAHGGLLFLDEIGELHPDMQALMLRAIEEKSFYPVGSDKVVHSDFQLIAGTCSDLDQAVQEGRFREDLHARIRLWSFELPSLRERKEDISPNIEFELQKISNLYGKRYVFQKDALEQFLRFAHSSEAIWTGNFRDLSAAMMRMATLCSRGRIRIEDVELEIQRLKRSWQVGQAVNRGLPAGLDESKFDLFDLEQLRSVVQVCQESRSLSDAGRRLFAVTRSLKQTSNDADRLQKYLARFGLKFTDLKNSL